MIEAKQNVEIKSEEGAGIPARRVKSKNTRLRSEILMKSLDSFYDNPEHFNALYEFCARKPKQSKKTRMSRRVLEFLCTKLAPKQPITVVSETGEAYDLHTRYQLFLRSVGKRFFDCFARNERAKFEFAKHGKKVKTTIGQLRFFRFFIRDGGLRYAREHLDEITKQMSEKLKSERKSKKDQDAKRKRISSDRKGKRKRRRHLAAVTTGEKDVKLSFHSNNGQLNAPEHSGGVNEQ